ncbi:MAG: hypothetical protein QG635_94, partial [Bacteroidota bacterium]|nr:hypothetical protein [Bacteroidota bacterium]
MNEKQLIAERIESLTGWNVNLRRLEIITD